MSYNSEPDGQLTLLELRDAPVPPRRRSRFKPEADLIAIPFLYLDLSPDHVDLFGKYYWELHSPYREGKPPLNTGPAPRNPDASLRNTGGKSRGKILSVQSRLPGNPAACGGTR